MGKLLKSFLILMVLVCLNACDFNFGNKANDVPTVTITFHKNDGSGKTVTQIVERNSTVILKVEEFTRDGFELLVWRVSEMSAPVR